MNACVHAISTHTYSGSVPCEHFHVFGRPCTLVCGAHSNVLAPPVMLWLRSGDARVGTLRCWHGWLDRVGTTVKPCSAVTWFTGVGYTPHFSKVQLSSCCWVGSLVAGVFWWPCLRVLIVCLSQTKGMWSFIRHRDCGVTCVFCTQAIFKGAFVASQCKGRHCSRGVLAKHRKTVGTPLGVGPEQHPGFCVVWAVVSFWRVRSSVSNHVAIRCCILQRQKRWSSSCVLFMI